MNDDKKVCRICGKEIESKDLSHHSPMGHHLPNYIEIHEECHRRLHDNPNWFYTKINQKWIKEIEDEYGQII